MASSISDNVVSNVVEPAIVVLLNVQMQEGNKLREIYDQFWPVSQNQYYKGLIDRVHKITEFPDMEELTRIQYELHIFWQRYDDIYHALQGVENLVLIMLTNRQTWIEAQKWIGARRTRRRGRWDFEYRDEQASPEFDTDGSVMVITYRKQKSTAGNSRDCPIEVDSSDLNLTRLGSSDHPIDCSDESPEYPVYVFVATPPNPYILGSAPVILNHII